MADFGNGEQVVVAQIVAGHAFNDVKARKVFNHIGVCRLWAEDKIKELTAAAIEEDPTFEFYSFDLETRIVNFDERESF